MEHGREEENRQEAIRLYQQGTKVSEICRRLECSRRWFHKWLKRYNSGDSKWLCERSRKPHRVANKTSRQREEEVIRVRQKLEKTKFSQVGALAIQREMQKLDLEPLPTWTIDRILKRNNLVREKKAYQPSGKPYPDVKQIFSDSIQPADLVGPRHIKKDGRFYSFNVIDLESYLAAFNPCRNKGDEAVAQGLLRAWKTIGKPDFFQMDNALSFRGSNRYPHSLGLVLRMCLALGVQAIFIPIGEPWRNGAVEKLQHVFDQVFFRQQFFTSYQELRREAKAFEAFRNENHRCSAIAGNVPVEFVRSQRIDIHQLSATVSLKQIDLSLADGYFHLIRFIRSDCRLDIFGEKFRLPKSVQYEYVIATICTKTQCLQVRVDDQLIDAFDYRMPIEYSRKC